MKSKFAKIWFMVAGGFVGLAAIYYVIRLIDTFVNPNRIEGTLLDKLNIYAIIALGVALLMLIAIIPLSKKLEAKAAHQELKKDQDHIILAKYKSKKNK
jgi:ribose/xylose/arabinose/galactoside ABC-type transport system permease subunit